jgi:hypothetical protein
MYRVMDNWINYTFFTAGHAQIGKDHTAKRNRAIHGSIAQELAVLSPFRSMSTLPLLHEPNQRCSACGCFFIGPSIISSIYMRERLGFLGHRNAVGPSCLGSGD